MNNISPILISDSDSEEERKVPLGPDEISCFIPASLTNSQATKNGGLNYSQKSPHVNAPTTSKNQMPIKIVDINAIMKGSSSIELRETINHENITSRNSNAIFSRNKKNIVFVRIPNPASVSVTQKPIVINYNVVGKNTKRKNKTPLRNNTRKKSTVESKIPYRCLDLKKGSFKIDWEGFTQYDRLGFFKAEQKRARRCFNILQNHIKVRENVLKDLVEKLENKISTTVDNPPNKVTRRTSIMTMKLLLSNDKISEMEAQSKKIIDKPKLRKIRRTPAKSTVKQPLTKKAPRKNSKGKQKLKIVEVPALDVPLDLDKSQESPDVNLSNNKTATFIDANNFELMEELDINHNNEELFFVNEHKVVTALYMDTFPAFKSAVQLQKVKIIDKINPTSETVVRDDKYAAFCDFMERYRVSPNSSEFVSDIYSEHSYSTKIYS